MLEKSCNRARERQTTISKKKKNPKNFKTRQQNTTNWKCVFCDGTVRKLNDFTKVKDIVERRQTMSSKKLFFKGLKSVYCAVYSPNRTCFKFSWKHQYHCVSTISHMTTPRKVIKSQKKICWLYLGKRTFTILLWLGMQIKLSLEPKWTD